MRLRLREGLRVCKMGRVRVRLGKRGRIKGGTWGRVKGGKGGRVSSSNKTLNARLLARVITGCHYT